MSDQLVPNTTLQSHPFNQGIHRISSGNTSSAHGLLFVYFIFLLLIIVVLSLPTTHANTYTTPFNKHVEPGETAYYYVRSWNNDHPLGVEVKFEITQDISTYNSQNTKFFLYPGEQDTMHLYVYTTGVTADEIHTNVTYYERDSTENEFRERGGVYFTTFIEHPEEVSSEERDIESGSHLYYIGAIGLMGFLLYIVYNRSAVTFPVIRGYSRLKKDKILENDTRREIWELLYEFEDGLQVVEIQRELNIQHRRLVEYHLQKLIEFGYARKIDTMFYPAGVGVEKPFIRKIKDAMEEGARTPAQVAKRIGSYREKVRYHMKKNGMW